MVLDGLDAGELRALFLMAVDAGFERHDVLERVRQVGPNKEGAKGSYSVYAVPA